MQGPITIIVRWLARMEKHQRRRFIIWFEVIVSLLLIAEIFQMIILKKQDWGVFHYLLDVVLIVSWAVSRRLKKLERFI
jgi:hypothetical protein